MYSSAIYYPETKEFVEFDLFNLTNVHSNYVYAKVLNSTNQVVLDISNDLGSNIEYLAGKFKYQIWHNFTNGNYKIVVDFKKSASSASFYHSEIPFTIGSNNLPATISSNTTLTGVWYVNQNVTINNNAIMTLNAGTQLILKPGVNITVLPGSRLLSFGTKESNVVISSKEGKYGKITLQGIECYFFWTKFENAVYGVDVQSSKAVFSNCNFNNCDYGLSSNYTTSGLKSDFYVNSCLFKENKFGLMIKNSKAIVINSTAISNYDSGIWFQNGYSDLFYGNLIENNNKEKIFEPSPKSNYGGLHLISNSYLVLSNWPHGRQESYYSTSVPTAAAGRNRIQNNRKYEIYIGDSNTRLFVGQLFNGSLLKGGYNRISDYDNGLPSDSKYIYNMALTQSGDAWISWNVSASMTYWNMNGGAPSNSAFYGSVTRNYPLTVDPTTESGAPIDEYPVNTMKEPYNPNRKPQIKNVLTSNMVESILGNANRKENSDDFIAKKQRIMNLRNELTQEENNLKSIRIIKEICELSLPDKEDKLKEYKNIKDIFSKHITRLKNSYNIVKKQKENENISNLIGEICLLQEIQRLVFLDSPVNEILFKINEASSLIANSDNRLSLLFYKLSQAERKRDYFMAKDILSSINQLKPDNNMIDGFAGSGYSVIEDQLNYSINHDENAELSETNLLSIGKTEATKSSLFMMEQNYPNPFNPTTMIPFTLAEKQKVKIEVYSITGQLIKTLVNSTFNQGQHSVEFNAAGLASGTYIYRATIGGKVISKKMQILK
ncbi:MAG: T9SS type A sorting domain-containing protein [Bacteroidetes bacterium]|nr:T9SS type A sorting domain-containing protein [Bacteroidota bacterium]